mgnify:CR=1 FL=1
MNNKYKWMYYRQAGAKKYIFTVLLVLGAAVIFSILDRDWTHISRMGGILTIFGASLMLHRLHRLGAVNCNKEKEPLVVNGNQLSPSGMFDDLGEKIDAHAIHIGFIVLILGTAFWSYGDYFFELLWPFNA